MARQTTPTPPITEALVGGAPALLDVIRAMASADPKLAKALRQHERAVGRANTAAALLTQIIEKRLKAVESAAEDVVNGTGNIIGLSSKTPLPVGESGAVGTEGAAAHGDHVHAGLSSIDGVTGAVTFSGAVSRIGNAFTFAGGGGAGYVLPTAAHKVAVGGTTYLALTIPIAIPQTHSDNQEFAFWLEAGNTGVNVLWRLRNRTALNDILTGTIGAPFSRSLVTNTGAASAMPAAGDEVALEVAFSGAGTGGLIGLTGGAPVWAVR